MESYICMYMQQGENNSRVPVRNPYLHSYIGTVGISVKYLHHIFVVVTN